MSAAAIIFSIAAAVLGLFQIALAAGAPWGAASYGGSHPGVLPKRLRIVSGVFGITVYPAMIVFVLYAGDVVGTGLDGGWSDVVLWVLAAFFTFQTVINAISPSRIERIWAPVALVMAICAVVLVLG